MIRSEAVVALGGRALARVRAQLRLPYRTKWQMAILCGLLRFGYSLSAMLATKHF